MRTLSQTDWRIGGSGGAADKLGLKRTTLISKMEKLGISRPPQQMVSPDSNHSTINFSLVSTSRI